MDTAVQPARTRASTGCYIFKARTAARNASPHYLDVWQPVAEDLQVPNVDLLQLFPACDGRGDWDVPQSFEPPMGRHDDFVTCSSCRLD